VVRKKSRPQRQIRYAVIGLGHIAQVAVLPAFANAQNSKLAAIVSSDPAKLKKLGRKYRAPGFSYERFEECMSECDIDAVYIALPNHLHCEFTLRAAAMGVHVLCEKPMATSEEECSRMIQATDEARVKLMIAYRLHFEKANLDAAELVQSGKLGEPRLFSSVFSQQVEAGNIRLLDETGGGTLWDVGIYCINAARYLFRSEPTEVLAMAATKREKRFAEREEMTAATLRFPNECLAQLTCSFGSASTNSYRVVGTQGDLRVEPAFNYVGELKHHITVNGKTRERTYEPRDQFAAELVYFSDCVTRDRAPEPSGLEGLIDVRIIAALYQSAATGQPVLLEPVVRQRRPTRKQSIRRPPHREPETIHVTPPSG
jgi:predicted dehydrogenase